MSRVKQQARIETHVIKTMVDWAALHRIDRIAAEARAELGEARWQELQKEWDQ